MSRHSGPATVEVAPATDWARALARPEVLALERPAAAMAHPASGRLHANENPWRSSADASIAGLNRYPEPEPLALEARLAAYYGVAPTSILATRGSDEGIDLLVRTFARPGMDAVLVCPPTFGMYAMSARLQSARLVEVPLLVNAGYALDEPAVLQNATADVRIVFLCTPNNPTGNAMDAGSLARIAAALRNRALVVIDEAYAEFDEKPSFVKRLAEFPNLVVLRTLSKALGLAGARCGAVLAAPALIDLLARVRPPYSVPTSSTEAILAAFAPGPLAETLSRVTALRGARRQLAATLAALPAVRQVFASDANFLLVAFHDPGAARAALDGVGITVRDLSQGAHTPACLRIAVGTRDENAELAAALARLPR